MNALHQLLRQSIGLNAASVGVSAIDHAVCRRMQSRGVARREDYLKLLRQSPVEWNHFVESVVVGETWFFRDQQPFDTLAALVTREWLPANPRGRLRVLSAPCSTGEEPYSIAMALLDAGVPPERFVIDAVDISARALIHAEQATYGRNSFRGQNLEFRDRYFQFQPARNGFVLNPAVRQQVRFRQGNVLDRECFERCSPYDFIFCRNLLIYFDLAARQKVLEKLRGLLAPYGMLFVGAAEVPLALENGFGPTGLPLSFACRKDESKRRQNFRQSLPALKRSRVRRLVGGSAAIPAAARELPMPLEPGAEIAALEQARRLAEAGRADEAAAICEAHLREHGVSAQAYYLLGLARGATGADRQAGEFYRRALYLQPDHYDALMHWARLFEKNGDGARARVLYERAGRARKTG